MTTTKPAAKKASSARKHTRTSEAKREDDLDFGAKITIEGESYEARIGDVTAPLARELRRNTGMGFMTLMNTIGEDPDIDVVSAFVWLARRLRGETVEFDDVEVDYKAMLADGFDVAIAGAEETAGDDPES